MLLAGLLQSDISTFTISSTKGELLSPRVLIFEDNDILRSTLESILKKRGYQVFTFSEPRLCQVFDSVDHHCPVDHACTDILISDVHMPSKTGLELIQERLQKGCKVKYRALMSGDWTRSDLKLAHELGCRVFHKPFNLSELLNWLADCTRQINLERKLSDLL